MAIDILSFVMGVICAYAVYCIITVIKKQTLPKIMHTVYLITNKDDKSSKKNKRYTECSIGFMANIDNTKD